MDISAIKVAPNSSIFLKLPLELRIMIYVLLLVSDFPRQIDFPTSRDPRRLSRRLGRIPAGSAAILRVCQQLHDEAEPILYKLNTFYFPQPSNDLGQFLAQISERAYESIESIALDFPLGDRYTLDLLMGCGRLKELAFVGTGLIPKSLLKYWGGLRAQSIKVSEDCQHTDPLRTNNFLTEIKPLRDWEDGQLTQSGQLLLNSFLELITGEKTRAQVERATETRNSKLKRFGRSKHFAKIHGKWLI